jgi:hypothetical protein
VDTHVAHFTVRDRHDGLKEVEGRSACDQDPHGAVNGIAWPMGEHDRFLGLVEYHVNDPRIVVEASRGAQ